MRLFHHSLISSFVVLALASSSAIAAEPQHAVEPSVLASAVSQHIAQQDADRAAIREALGRPEVREFAAKAGVDLDRATETVNTLSGSSLAQAAATATQVNDSLAGGGVSGAMSTTALVVVVLLLLLIVLAVR